MSGHDRNGNRRQSDTDYDAVHDAQYDTHHRIQQIARGVSPEHVDAQRPTPRPVSEARADAGIVPGMAGTRPTSEEALRAHIAANPVDGTPSEMREAFARLTGPAPELSYVRLGDVRCARIGDGPRQALWLHGGGYVFGSPESHAHAARALAARIDGTILIPDYPLAPEAVWPAQEEAVSAVLDGLEEPVAVIGDSSGGHLALRLALRRPGRIAALVLISPNSDRSGRSSTRERRSDLMNTDAQDSRLARMLVGDRPIPSAALSPILDDLRGLPALQIHAATNEILLDDSLLLARAAALAGVATDLRIWPGLFHMWHLWPEALSEARDTLDVIARHLCRIWDAAPETREPALGQGSSRKSTDPDPSDG